MSAQSSVPAASKSRPSTCVSSNSRETWMTARGTTRMGKGILIFTGPDGRRNQEVKVCDDNKYIGISEVSVEKSSELLYLYRPATGAPFHRAKSDIPGSIGWGLPRTGDPKTWPVHLKICSPETASNNAGSTLLSQSTVQCQFHAQTTVKEGLILANLLGIQENQRKRRGNMD